MVVESLSSVTGIEDGCVRGEKAGKVVDSLHQSISSGKLDIPGSVHKYIQVIQLVTFVHQSLQKGQPRSSKRKMTGVQHTLYKKFGDGHRKCMSRYERVT